MTIRSNPIYISSDVHRWLRLLAKANSGMVRTEIMGGSAELPRVVTPDEIADQILRQSIREQHPTLPDLQKKIEKLEKETIDTLKNENSPISRAGD